MAEQVVKVPVRLIRRVRSHSASVSSWNGTLEITPPQLISTSTRSKSPSTRAITSRIFSGLPRSMR